MPYGVRDCLCCPVVFRHILSNSVFRPLEDDAEYYRSMRKYGFCTYVRSLTNQINVVIHSRVSDSVGYTWPSCVGDDLHAERVKEQSQSYRSKV